MLRTERSSVSALADLMTTVHAVCVIMKIGVVSKDSEVFELSAGYQQ